VDLAAVRQVPLTVRSSFDDSPGTRLVEEEAMEGAKVQAIAHRADCSIVVAEGNAGGRGEARGIIESVADAFPELELIAHEQASDAHGAVVWIGSRPDAEGLSEVFQKLRGPGGEWKLAVEHDAGFVSAVGFGLGAREALRAESALERAGVPLVALRTTPTALIFRVPTGYTDVAVRALHATFLE
jgi:aspartokinase